MSLGDVNHNVDNSSPISNTNLLDNWYLVDPINQREVSGVIIKKDYFIDRWILVDGSVEITPEGLLLNGQIQQKIENSIGEENIVATALTTEGILQAEYDDSIKTFSITAENKIIVAAKLEVGKQQTLAYIEDGTYHILDHVPDYTHRMLTCQRYFYAVPKTNNDRICFSNCTQSGGYNAKEFDVEISLPVRLRIFPTFTYNADEMTFTSYGTTANFDTKFVITSISFSGWSSVNLLKLYFNSATNTAYEKSGTVQMAGTNLYMHFSADL